MYKSLIHFKDLDGQIYKVGEDYPRGNADEKRIQQLLTSDNRTNKPVIVVADLKFEPQNEQNETVDFDTMTRAQMEEYAAGNGIDLSRATNNAERRELLKNELA